MIEKKLANTLVKIAAEQFKAGTLLKKDRMNRVRKIEDLYNNKIIQVDDGRINIPFPIMSDHIDKIFSKIDNPPTMTFKIPNRHKLSAKVAAAWVMDSSSMRAGWGQKDRNEKKNALKSGVGISKVFASSVDNKYEAHYGVVDHLSFVCEGTKGDLEKNRYGGQKDIWKTDAELKQFVDDGIYDKANSNKLIGLLKEGQSKNIQADQELYYDRMQSLGLQPENNAFVKQKAVNLTEWGMDYNGKRYYLVFDPKTKIWVRAEVLKDVFENNRWPWITWAPNGEESIFWTKGNGDDVYPVAEAMRLTLNEALENNRRRNRPQRVVDADDFPDVNEIQDYVPDDIIVKKKGSKGEIITIETPEIQSSINLVEFFNAFLNEKTGVAGQGVEEKDVKVGVFFGRLETEADRIGIYNKAYSEGYARKAYNYFWGLKEHLTGTKAVEMLGKNGINWEEELSSVDFEGVDDVDNIITSGGAREEQLNEVQKKNKRETIETITANPATMVQLNQRWLVKTLLKVGGWEEDDIQQAMDTQGGGNEELMKEADEAIQQILLGKTPDLNLGANIQFMQRILDYATDNFNYIKLDREGNETGVEEKILETYLALVNFMSAHQKVAIENMSRDLRRIAVEMQTQPQDGPGVEMPVPGKKEQQAGLARPFENPEGTPSGTAERSQVLSGALR